MILEHFKPYIKLIVVFLTIFIIITSIGFYFIFDYYKDVHKYNYIIVTCQDPNTLEISRERYNNTFEFENSPLICGEVNNRYNNNLIMTYETEYIGMRLENNYTTKLIIEPVIK